MRREWVEPADALWTFDVQQLQWQQRQSTGTMPTPALCVGLAMVGDQAYVLVNHHDDQPGCYANAADQRRQMEVYVLDLKTWHWTQLPSQDSAPTCAVEVCPAVVKVSTAAADAS